MGYNVFQNNKLLNSLMCDKNWNLYNLLDIFQDDTKNALKIKKEEYLLEGENPIVDQGQSYIGGYTNRNDKLYKNIPSIIFGDHTKKIKYVDFPMFIGADGVKLLKPTLNNKELNVKYVYYFLKSIELPSDGYSRHFKYLKQLVIPVPIIIIQNKIVDVLDKAQDLIDKRKEQIEALDELVKSRFMEMFENTNFEEQELLYYIKNDAGLSYGIVVPGDNCQGGVPMIRPIDYVNNEINFENLYKVDKEIEQKYAKTRLNGNEILVTVIGSNMGQIMLTNNKCIGMNVTRNLAVIRQDDNKINKYYLREYLLSEKGQSYLKGQVNTSTIKQLPLNKLKQMPVPAPPIDIQNQFADFVNKVDKLKLEMQKSLEELENNYQSLMHIAFKGELFN